MICVLMRNGVFAAFLFTTLVVVALGVLTKWQWFLLYLFAGFASLYVFARVFDPKRDEREDAPSSPYEYTGLPLGAATNDMLGIGGRANDEVSAFRLLQNGSMDEHGRLHSPDELRARIERDEAN